MILRTARNTFYNNQLLWYLQIIVTFKIYHIFCKMLYVIFPKNCVTNNSLQKLQYFRNIWISLQNIVTRVQYVVVLSGLILFEMAEDK